MGGLFCFAPGMLIRVPAKMTVLSTPIFSLLTKIKSRAIYRPAFGLKI
jgi:hypothetical protein